VVAAVARSANSLKTYGPNVALLLHPDSTIIVAQTQHGYLLTYTIASDPNTRVYQQLFDHSNPHRRQLMARHFAGEDSIGIHDVSIRFRMAIKVESGIGKALALDNELLVATIKPAAIQCIRWSPDKNGSQTNSELLSRILGIPKQTNVVDMVYDRAMNLLLWVTSGGHAYTIQRIAETERDKDEPKKMFKGYCFHRPENEVGQALKAAVNARFSLLAVSCADGNILVYTAKDYMGNVVLSHVLQPPVSIATAGPLNFMSYSPDGYCFFAGYESGWANWSVFGRPVGNSFSVDRSLAELNSEQWLNGVSRGYWIGGGSDIVLTRHGDRRLWILETARSSLTGCYSSANLSRALLQTGTEAILYRGHDLSDIMTISGKDSLWHHAQYPPSYLHSQWPIRACVVSQDGRYIGIAGRRGLAHYSVISGRWKTFEDKKAENSFAVRGGMCWYGHILIAAIESDGSYEVSLPKSVAIGFLSSQICSFGCIQESFHCSPIIFYTRNIYPHRRFSLDRLEKIRSLFTPTIMSFTIMSSIRCSLGLH
jgi:RAB6A-GEF complex partner protein 1